MDLYCDSLKKVTMGMTLKKKEIIIFLKMLKQISIYYILLSLKILYIIYLLIVFIRIVMNFQNILELNSYPEYF